MIMTGDSICHDCGVKEGEIHELGCDMEICCFCGGQLFSCECCYKELGLFDKKKYNASTAYLPPKIYAHGLTMAQQRKWEAILNAKGRWPYIQYPNVCAKCGKLWPDLFMVSDGEWKRYIQPNVRHKVI